VNSILWFVLVFNVGRDALIEKKLNDGFISFQSSYFVLFFSKEKRMSSTDSRVFKVEVGRKFYPCEEECLPICSLDCRPLSIAAKSFERTWLQWRPDATKGPKYQVERTPNSEGEFGRRSRQSSNRHLESAANTLEKRGKKKKKKN
jgi:hypothetical protein